MTRFLKIACLMAMLVATSVSGARVVKEVEDPRFCGAPVRTEDGRIARSRSVLASFQKRYPCPSTGKTAGACPGWAIDHVIPLACGGCDAVVNLQWLPDDLKSKAGTGKDRFERVIYQTSIQCNTSAK